jgi:hypothetical protein
LIFIHKKTFRLSNNISILRAFQAVYISVYCHYITGPSCDSISRKVRFCSNLESVSERSSQMPTRALILLIFFLLGVGLLSLSGLTTAQTITSTPTPTLIPATVAPTVFYVTTFTPPTATPGCPVPLGLQIGGTAVVHGGVYVRTRPNASSPFVNYYQDAVTVTIVDGPVCDGTYYNWWAVRGPGNDGWVAEGRPSTGYWMRVGDPPPGSDCGVAADLTVGKETLLLLDVKVHQNPGLQELVLTVAPAGATAAVLEGPVCADDRYWWRAQVTVLDVLYTGWMADAGEGLALLADLEKVNQPVCDNPRNLVIGSQAYVNYKAGESPKNMRSGPGTNYEIVATLLDGLGFEILNGPICAADGYNWWQIRILTRPDVAGWFADTWIQSLPLKPRPA